MGNLAERWGKVGSAFSLRKGETEKSHSSTGLHRLNFVLPQDRTTGLTAILARSILLSEWFLFVAACTSSAPSCSLHVRTLPGWQSTSGLCCPAFARTESSRGRQLQSTARNGCATGLVPGLAYLAARGEPG